MRFVAPDRYAALKATGKLPSPKGIALSIVRLLQRDDFRIADLVQRVQSDPAIAGRILYFANAAVFARSRPIVALQRAIVALGAFRVRDLVIGLSVMHSHKIGLCPAFDYEAFWGHSLATGIACQELASAAQIASEEIFTIGLLARIGELALASIYPEDYAGLLVMAREDRLEFSPQASAQMATRERERFGLDHQQLVASLLKEWGLPEVLIQAAYHHENPDAAGFADGSRVQTLTHSLSFASALAHLCMVDEASRWSLLPALLARAARLGIGGEALSELVDRMVARWREWGAKLQVRTQDLPPFSEILAASPPLRSMGSADTESGRLHAECLPVQLIGIPPTERAPLLKQIEELGHRPQAVDDTQEGVAHVLHHTAQIVIVDLALHTRSAADFCRKLRQTPSGKECYALLLLPAGSESRTRELMAAGADDILLKPLNAQVLRVHLSTAARMRVLRAEIQRERVDIVRSTDEFAVAQKRLLQDALTDTLTQLPNRRYGLDFLASEWAFAQTSGAPIAFLMLDIDHFKRVNDTYGHAAGDVLLRQLADILKRTSRAEDMVFRYGGEEFGAILTNASLRTALQIGERIRLLVEKTPFQWEGQRLKATLSVGVALSSGREAESLVLIRAADAALYQAKARGRNRVVAAASTSSAAAAPPDE